MSKDLGLILPCLLFYMACRMTTNLDNKPKGLQKQRQFYGNGN